MRSRFARVILVGSLLCDIGCGAVAPPASQLPTGEAALARMKATFQCGNGIQAEAKIDHYGERGRVRGDMMLFAARPANVRMDVFAPPPLSQAVATLATNGRTFSFANLPEHRFYFGPASPCAIALLTSVAIPGSALVDLLHGQAPLLRHEAAAATVAWSGNGYYVVDIPSTRDAFEEVHLAPRPDDWTKPWGEQRMRVLDVVVKQQGIVLYHAAMDGHEAAPMGKPRYDETGEAAPIMPIGPVCDAEVPRRIHVEVPYRSDDVQFKYTSVEWNPPVEPSAFEQERQPGLQNVPVTCDEAGGR
jgi:hypothetical protein